MAESLRNLREAIAPRPDPEALLRNAIRERDGTATARLVQQWVHRRGLHDFERFQEELLIPEDPEAGFWLRRQWDAPLAAPSTSASSVPDSLPPETKLHATAAVTIQESLAPSETLPAPAAPPSSGGISVPAEAEEMPHGTAPSPLLSESFTEPLCEELRMLLATPLEDPFGEPAPRQSRSSAPMGSSLPGSPWEPLQPSTSPDPNEGPEATFIAELQDSDSPQARRGTLSRVKARMRGYFEDAMGVLQRAAFPSNPEEEGADVPDATSGPSAISFSGPIASHPGSDQADLASEVPPGQEKSVVAAPSPTTLADLRSWLPDATGDLPRAS